MADVVNLDAYRDARRAEALDRLAAVVAANPAIQARTARYFRSLEPTMRPPKTTKTTKTKKTESSGQPVKLPADLIDEADALIATLQAAPSGFRGYGRATRALVIRMALTRGLEALRADLASVQAAG